MRPKGSEGFDDTEATFVQSASALVIETSDGSGFVLVAKVPSMSTMWKGRAHLVTDGTVSYLVDVNNHELLTIGKGGVPVHTRTLGDEETVETLRETHPRIPTTTLPSPGHPSSPVTWAPGSFPSPRARPRR